VDEQRRRDSGGVGRRTWLAGALAGWLVGRRAWGDEPPGPADDERRDEEMAREAARKAGLKGVGSTRSANYLAVGDAPEGFRALTLRDCEALARDFLEHYKAQGFEVERPGRRMTVVTLADDRSFAAYMGNPRLRLTAKMIDPDPAIHGLYNHKANALVVFDHRALGPQLGARGGYENLRVVAHEGTHQLCFNTGLLDRHGDAPKAIVEGLAVYGEVWPTTGPGRSASAPGQLNRMRLSDLAGGQRRGLAWITVEQLLTDDRPMTMTKAATRQGLLAYAESWLLVDLLMKDRARLPGFRAYLKAVRARRDPSTRLDDARTHLGDLSRLNRDLRAYSVRLLRES
jgi:hypothetical protein